MLIRLEDDGTISRVQHFPWTLWTPSILGSEMGIYYVDQNGSSHIAKLAP